MKFVLAPDSFKESLSARRAAEAMERGIRAALPGAEIVLLPVADGGEGTAETMVWASGGTLHEATVTGPMGRPVVARYGMLGDGETAVVEMAEASGLHLVPLNERNPLLTTTFGTGELIKAALDRGARLLIVAIGGSATSDAGAGALQALGARLLDEKGRPLGLGGGALAALGRIDLRDLDPRLAGAAMRVASDVTNTLHGPQGASAVFGPQKGATPEMVSVLDANLRRFSDVLRRDTGIDVGTLPGGGAAGGLGAGLVACGGTLVPGIDLVLDALGFDRAIQGADAVFTGEGRIDSQTPRGKVIAGIVRRAGQQRVPVIAFAGSVSPGYESLFSRGLVAVQTLLPGPSSLEEALSGAEDNLCRAAEGVARMIEVFRRPR
jgi:glycerate kinase